MASESRAERLRWVVELSREPLRAIETVPLKSYSKWARGTAIAAGLILFSSVANAGSAKYSGGDLVRMFVVGLVVGAISLYLTIRIRRVNAALAAHKQKWSPIFHYFESLPNRPVTLEDAAAANAIDVAYWIAHTKVWQHPDLLDKHDARLDLLTELHAVLDAAQDIAAVRRTVGKRTASYADQWQTDIDALDRLARQVQDRVSILHQYRETIARIMATMDDVADQQRRRAAASAVDDLVRRRGGDEMLTRAAALRAADIASSEPRVAAYLRAAHDVKSIFDTPFVITR
ncbi:hypothetical protein [Cumulibacter manganitolerans]|uniref:hypothetical protein n=1 Tax=Cumulibacter manganitolerans TaxID=1884992 RepID=UPI0012964121|nr:hypothetical protein [Cumulibacter manganitolerans]